MSLVVSIINRSTKLKSPLSSEKSGKENPTELKLEWGTIQELGTKKSRRFSSLSPGQHRWHEGRIQEPGLRQLQQS